MSDHSPKTEGNVLFYSLCAGTFSAFGSTLGKVSGYFESMTYMALCYIVMICVNSVGFLMFAKALNVSSTSLRPTLLSTASSYCTSALIGVTVFGEGTSPLRWLGTFLILMGVVCIAKSGNDKNKSD